MTKFEFLSKLREALSEELSSQAIEEHVHYYEQYITDAVMSGQAESAVLDELGDPWIIARTIMDVNPVAANAEYVYDSEEERCEEHTSSYSSNGLKVYQLDAWWKKALLILGILLILGLVLSIVTGIISLLAPIIIPVAVFMFILKIFRRR